MELLLEEKKLMVYAKEGDKEAEEKFLNDNKGLVHLVVRKFYDRGVENDDLIQLGMMGLYKAMKNFDFSFQVKFSTYAVPMIAGEIKRYLRDDSFIKVSRNTKEQYTKIKKISDEYERNFGKHPTISELSDLCKINKEELLFILGAGDRVISLDENINKEDEKENLIDKISDCKCENEDKIINKITLKEILNNLKAREKQIIILRYFKDMTQQQVADILKISQVQVCRIEKKVLEKLREELDK